MMHNEYLSFLICNGIIKGPESWWIAKSITPQLVVNQPKINPPTFRSFDYTIAN